MVRRLTLSHLLAFMFLVLVTLSSQSDGAEPREAETLLPDTAKCYLSIGNLDELLQKWQQTAVGELVTRPALKPFVDDMMRQFQENMSLVRLLGTDWSELKQLKMRGVDWAIVQPDNDPEQVAVAFVGSVAAGEDARQVLAALLDLIRAEDIKISRETLAGQPIQTVQWPKQGQYDRARAAYFLADETFILASDRQDILAAMIQRRTDDSGSLRHFKPYAEIMRRCELSNLDRPDVRWFIEPFGFVEALRASNGGRRKRGRDLLKILPRQGFAAIQGVGGVVRLNYQDFDNLAEAYLYAPAAPGQPASRGGDRFVKAARMLSFPNGHDATPLDWIPADVGSYITLRCRLGEAFEHSKSLVDDLASQPVFEDVLKSIELDPNGPQVNLREAIVRHLGQRVILLTEPRPAKTAEGQRQGGRMAGIAIELTDSAAVDKSLTKIMATDPNAQRIEHDGAVLWVMTTATDEAAPDELGGFDSFASDDDFQDDFQDDGLQLFPNRIFLVAHDHLIVTTTETLAKKLLKRMPREESLAGSGRYDRVGQTLADLGAAEDCFRFFVRTSKFVESAYRQLRLSERTDIFGNFGPLMEKVWVDGEKLPPYEQIATDLGDSGVYVHSENDGWKIVGFLLKNETGE